jgi:hypothetical protein
LPAGLAPDHVLLSVEEQSGWPGSDGTFDPRLATLEADGRLIVRVPSTGVHLPIAARTLDRASLEAAWGLVARSGVATDGSLDLPGLFDASTTAFRVDDGSRATSLSIYGLGSLPAAGTFRPAEGGLREAASGLLTALQLLAGSDPWRPPALLLWWAEDPPPDEGATRVVAWTAPVALATAGRAVDRILFDRCLRLDGADAEQVGALVGSLPPDVLVEQDAHRYRIAVRPIYPDELDEVGCPGSG